MEAEALGREALPLTCTEIRDGIEAQLHRGAQLYVSIGGAPVADLALGEARPGQAMDRDHLLPWLSAGKPLTAVAIAQLWERDLLTLDDPVARRIPEFGIKGKEAITIRHLLTHTAGIRMMDDGWPRMEWSEILTRICDKKLEPRWIPGSTAGYHRTAGWFVLGEIVRRLAGEEFSFYVRDRICSPAGMADSWIGMPPETIRAYGDRIAPIYAAEEGALKDARWISERRLASSSPGAGACGPIRELGRFYEVLFGWGGRDRLLSPQTVEALTARHRVDLFDKTFRQNLDWGLGFVPNPGADTSTDQAYGYGRHASARAVGHGGYRSTVGFADPEHRLVVAVAFNGLPDERLHRRRVNRVTRLLYEDLGLKTAQS